MDNLILNGQVLEMSTDKNDDLKIKFLICPLDEVNHNNVGIKESDITEEEKFGIKDKAVVTKVIKDNNGDYNFSGHNLKIKNVVDKNGNITKEYEFDTNAVGFHKEVWIEKIEIDGENKKCIVAEAIIWKRYPRVIEVIERLGTKLRTSWEILYDECYYEGKNKWIKGLKWLGNCMLGTNVRPAYPIAGALEISEEENQEYELSIATYQDLSGDIAINDLNIRKGGEEMVDENKNKNKNIETSSISDEDLRSKVVRAIYALEREEKYFYGILIYPYDFIAYAKLGGKDSKVEDYVKFTFVVNSDDTVAITSQENVKMIFVPKAQQEAEIAELNKKISEKEAELSSKMEEIVKLGEVIKNNETALAEKDKEISNLIPYKEKVEKAEAEAREAELAQAREVLKQKALSSKYVTEEEIETSEELKRAIQELDEKAINSYIGQKVVEYASQKLNEKEENEIEISKVKKQVKVDINLNQYDYQKGNPIFDFLKK